jgi:hypothetical protein
MTRLPICERSIASSVVQRRWLVSLTNATDAPPSDQNSTVVMEAGAVAIRQIRSCGIPNTCARTVMMGLR